MRDEPVVVSLGDLSVGGVLPSAELVLALQRLRREEDVFEGDVAEAERFAPKLVALVLGHEVSPPGWVLEVAARFGDGLTMHAIGDWAMQTTDATLPEGAAQAAVGVLSRRGDAVALMQLQRIANEAQSSMLSALAARELESLAELRGLRVWELEDLSVPLCGLASDEVYPFDFGRQKFLLRLDAWLRPRLFDPVGRRFYAELPEGGDGDELARVEAARKRFEMVRADVEDLLPVQARRLEVALAEQHRWRVEHWRANVLGHPVMRLLIQRLVWGTYSAAGRCVGTFRVGDDFSLTDQSDAPFALGEDVLVGVLHPLDVEQEVVRAWSALFSDYEIVGVCPQFDRPVYRPSAELRKEEHLPIELEVDSEWGLRYLVGHRWRKELGRWAGWEPIRRVFRTADVRAELNVTLQEGTLQLHGVSFSRFLGHPHSNFQLRDVPKVVYSETVREFEELRAAWSAQDHDV